MQPVFHRVKCPGSDCPRFLRYSVTEADYGTTKVLGCPRCFAEIGVKIMQPPAQQKSRGLDDEGSGIADIFKKITDLFGDYKNKNK